MRNVSVSKLKSIFSKRDADIIILTESSTNAEIEGDYFHVHSKRLNSVHDSYSYSEDERRISIWSKYPIERKLKTSDEYTSILIEVSTPIGPVLVYACIIGIDGANTKFFNRDLKNTIRDLSNRSPEENIILVGDFNILLDGSFWPSRESVKALNEMVDNLKLRILTRELSINVDHICVTKKLLTRVTSIETWNENKELSDHRGIIGKI